MDMSIRREEAKSIIRSILDDGDAVWATGNGYESCFVAHKDGMRITFSMHMFDGPCMAFMVDVDKPKWHRLSRQIVASALFFEGNDGFDLMSEMYQSIC